MRFHYTTHVKSTHTIIQLQNIFDKVTFFHFGLEKVVKLGYIGIKPFSSSRVIYLHGVSQQPEVKLTDR